MPASKRPPGEYGSSGGADEIDLGELGRAVWAKRRAIWIPTLASVAAMLAFILVASPRYTGEAKVLLDNQESYLTRPDRAMGEGAGALDPEAVQSQIQLLTSRDLAREAARKLGLVGKAEFDPAAGGFNPFRSFMVLIGLQADPFALPPEERVLEKYYNALTVFQAPRTRVLVVEFTSKDPDLAARGANVVAETFIGLRSGAKKDDARQAGAWLAGNIDDLRRKVAESEAHVEAFRSQTGLLGAANNQTVLSQQLSELNSQLSAARSAQSDSQSKARIIRDLIRQGRVFEVPDIARDELVRRISEQRVTLKSQLALESRSLLPGHPRIKELQAQIADVENELRNAAEKAARTLEHEAKMAGARVEGLTAALDSQKKTVSTGNEDEVQLRALEREAKSARDQLESYLAKYREAVARDNESAGPADARVISRAVAPQLPSFPKKVPLFLIAFLAGFILSLSFVVARELFAGLRSAPRRAQPHVLPGSEAYGDDDVPTGRERREPDFGVQEAARSVTLAAPFQAAAPSLVASSIVEDLCAHLPGCIVAAVSPTSHAGAAVMDLARSLARHRRIVFVDFDPASGAFGAGEGGVLPQGLSELQSGLASFAEVIQRDSVSRLNVIAPGSAAVDCESIGFVLDALSAAYDGVILNLPALATSPDAFILAPRSDVVLLGLSGEGAGGVLEAAAKEELAAAGARRVETWRMDPMEHGRLAA